MSGEPSSNRTTIESYETCALDYARSTAPKPGWEGTPGMRRFVKAIPTDGNVLEIGSGPGWDADWLESRGVTVNRTDATRAFVDFQTGRGARAELLDIVTDCIGGPYSGVIAQYVFQHIERSMLPQVLAKIARALVPGGAFLFILREGQRDVVEGRTGENRYLITEWDRPGLRSILDALHLTEVWTDSMTDVDGDWLAALVRKDGCA